MNTQSLRAPTTQGPRLVIKQQGFTLIEALVAILIFVVGVLGLVGLQTASTLTQTETRARSEAAFLAQEMIGLMWTDMGRLNQYAISSGSDCSAAACQQWLAKIRATLPQGNAIVTPTAITNANGLNIGSDVALTIRWQTPNGDQRQYQTTTAIIPGSS